MVMDAVTPDAEDEANSIITDFDRDSIHTLPLLLMPLENRSLRRARLVRNVRLDIKIELYRARELGSAQIDFDDVPKYFGAESDRGTIEHDLSIIRKLAALPAFDCYSVRRALRDVGIKVDQQDAFSLTESKRRELLVHMRGLTRPLINFLYGEKGGPTLEDPKQLIELISNPDADAVRQRLVLLSDGLKVDLDDLPNMLDGFGDVFLSLAYYRGYFASVIPSLNKLTGWIEDVVVNSYMSNDKPLCDQLKRMIIIIRDVAARVSARFENFDKNTSIDWDAVTPRTFNGVRHLIEEHQASLAEVVAGLTVKMYEWEEKFPNGGGAPVKRTDFMMSDIKPGLDRLMQVELDAPSVELPSARAAA